MRHQPNLGKGGVMRHKWFPPPSPRDTHRWAFTRPPEHLGLREMVDADNARAIAEAEAEAAALWEQDKRKVLAVALLMAFFILMGWFVTNLESSRA